MSAPQLPPMDDVLSARAWLLAGAPAAARGHDPAAAVTTLLQLINALPAALAAARKEAAP